MRTRALLICAIGLICGSPGATTAAPAARADPAHRGTTAESGPGVDRTGADRTATAATAATDATEALDAIDAELAEPRRAVHGPRVDAVVAAAYAAAGLDHDPRDSWIRRARLAGLVPWLTVRTARDTSWQDDNSDVGHSTSLEARATWRLDRLLFDSKELQVAALETARHRERRRLATRAIRAYFAWRRAARIASDDDRVTTRVAETIAELDALTDGWFSAQLARPPAARAQGNAEPR